MRQVADGRDGPDGLLRRRDHRPAGLAPGRRPGRCATSGSTVGCGLLRTLLSRLETDGPRPGLDRGTARDPTSGALHLLDELRPGLGPGPDRRPRVGVMCGRYASLTPTRGPHRGVRGRRRAGSPAPLAADYNVAPTKEVYAVVERPPSRGRAPEPAERQLRVLTLGAGAVVGQGPLDRQPDDQRPDGDGRREAGVPAGVRVAPLPAARPTATSSGTPPQQLGQGRQAASSSRSSSGPQRRRRAGDGRALRDLARPDARPTTTPTGSAGPARCSPPTPRTPSATSTTGCR